MIRIRKLNFVMILTVALHYTFLLLRGLKIARVGGILLLLFVISDMVYFK